MTPFDAAVFVTLTLAWLVGIGFVVWVVLLIGSLIWEAVSGILDKFDIDWGTVFGVGLAVGILALVIFLRS